MEIEFGIGVNDTSVGLEFYLGIDMFGIRLFTVDINKSVYIPSDGVLLGPTPLFQLCHDITWLPGSPSFGSRRLLGADGGAFDTHSGVAGALSGSRRSLRSVGEPDYSLLLTSGSPSATIEANAPLYVENSTRPTCSSAGSATGVMQTNSMYIMDITSNKSFLSVNPNIDLPSGQCTISAVVVNATLEHSYPADLDVSLKSPIGTSITLSGNKRVDDTHVSGCQARHG